MATKRFSKRVPSRQRGVSLIEVLVALVVLTTGILALTLLEVTVTRAAADAKTRSYAMGYAQAELERIRAQATNLTNYQNLVDTSATTISGASAATGTAFQLQKTVNRYVRSTDDTACGGTGKAPCFVLNGTDNGTPDLSIPEYKTVTATVSWTGADSATAKTVSAIDTISMLSTNGSAGLVSEVSTSNSVSPIVLQSKSVSGMDAQGVIPIATGGDDGQATAASNPKPLVDSSTGTAATSFNVLTYLDGNTGNIEVQREVETQILACKCKYGSFASGTSSFFTTQYRPTYWTGSKYASPQTVSEAGVTGVPSAIAATSETYTNSGGSTVTRTINQSELCDDCCRDHHDPSGMASSAVKFDPYSTTTHDHYHYDLDTSGSPKVVSGVSPIKVNTNETKVYTEACRMIRVDGVWHTAVDMNLEHMAFLATNQTTTTSGGVTTYAWAPTSTATNHYVDFVKQYLKARAIDVGTSPATSTNDTLTPSEATTLETANSINSPSVLAIATATSTKKYLHDRGLYLDYLSDEAKDVLDGQLKDCDKTGDAMVECILAYLPFVTINATELANYSSTSNLAATNASLDGSDTSEPTRGVVQPVGTNSNGSTGSATSTMLRSNSGLVFLYPYAIDPFDGQVVQDPAQTLTDTQNFQFSDSGIIDTDNDGVEDGSDNCPTVANASQTNTDGADDGGDACDPDDDNDGIADGSDNCPLKSNADQSMAIHNGPVSGDACWVDTDVDGFEDLADNCPTTYNPDQADSNSDGQGDACTVANDQDNDGVVNGSDNCVSVANADQLDSDGDGTGDACDASPYPSLAFDLVLGATTQGFPAIPTTSWTSSPANGQAGGGPQSSSGASPYNSVTYHFAGVNSKSIALTISKFSQFTAGSSTGANPCKKTTGTGYGGVTCSSSSPCGGKKATVLNCVVYTPGNMTIPSGYSGSSAVPFSPVVTYSSGSSPFTGSGNQASAPTYTSDASRVTYTMTGLTSGASDRYTVTFTGTVTDWLNTNHYTCDNDTTSPTYGQPVYTYSDCK